MSCGQIHSMPVLNPEGSLETEITAMREAIEWQNKESLDACCKEQKIEEEVYVCLYRPV
jgi:hypothetical protein